MKGNNRTLPVSLVVLRVCSLLQIHMENFPVVQQKQEIGNCWANSDEDYSLHPSCLNEGDNQKLVGASGSGVGVGGREMDVWMGHFFPCKLKIKALRQILKVGSLFPAPLDSLPLCLSGFGAPGCIFSPILPTPHRYEKHGGTLQTQQAQALWSLPEPQQTWYPVFFRCF